MGQQFVSKDGKQTYFAAIYKSGVDADKTTEHLREELGRVDGVQVGGFGPAYQEVNEHVESDLVTAELIAFPLLFLVSLWVFRSAVAALLPLLVGGLTIVTSLLIVRGINEFVDISIFALNLITGLGLGLAIDYSLFLVSRYREELERVGPGAEAVRRTVADRRAYRRVLGGHGRRRRSRVAGLPAALPLLDGHRRDGRGARRCGGVPDRPARTVRGAAAPGQRAGAEALARGADRRVAGRGARVLVPRVEVRHAVPGRHGDRGRGDPAGAGHARSSG